MRLDAVIRSTTARLKLAQIENAAHDARSLITFGLACAAIDLITHADREISDLEISAISKLIDRRINREPLQHIIGTVNFYGLWLKSDRRALIPRHDSEVLVDAVLGAQGTDFNGVIADFGTGSGCLLAAILMNQPKARGIAIDISEAALSLAEENFHHLGISDRIGVVCRDWSAFTDWSMIDIMVSNPPYIVAAEIPTLSAEVSRHDPFIALSGGEDGLKAYDSLLQNAKRLRPNTPLFLEIGARQAHAVANLMTHHGHRFSKSLKDLGGNDRVICGISG